MKQRNKEKSTRNENNIEKMGVNRIRDDRKRHRRKATLVKETVEGASEENTRRIWRRNNRSTRNKQHMTTKRPNENKEWTNKYKRNSADLHGRQYKETPPQEQTTDREEETKNERETTREKVEETVQKMKDDSNDRNYKRT